MGTVVLVLVAMTGGPKPTVGWTNTVPWLGGLDLQQPQQPQQQQQQEMKMMRRRMEPPTTAPLSISFISYHKARIPEPEKDNTSSIMFKHRKRKMGKRRKNLPLLAPCSTTTLNSRLPPFPSSPPLKTATQTNDDDCLHFLFYLPLSKINSLVSF